LDPSLKKIVAEFACLDPHWPEAQLAA
jgi:hypothetical protein